MQHRIIQAFDIISTYGPAWYSRFTNLYMAMSEEVSVDFWPGVPWSFSLEADEKVTEGKWFYAADLVNNPKRKTV